jgi:Lrp/AsnC family transcriptional regulator, leucine-responsive regulatory protein
VIDEIDKKIVSLIQGNAKLSNAEIAESVGLTASSVHERVKKLEKKDYVTGYAAIVDAEKLGKPLLAFVRLTVGAQKEVKTGIQKLCQTEPDILECHNVAGEDCYILKIRSAGPKQLERMLSAIKSISDTIRSVTNIVLSSFKETSYIEAIAERDGEAGEKEGHVS